MRNITFKILIVTLAFAWAFPAVAKEEADTEAVKERKAVEERQKSVKSKQQQLLERRAKLVRNYRDRVQEKPGTTYSYSGRRERTSRTTGRLTGDEARSAYDEELVKTDVKSKSERTVRSIYMREKNPESERFRNEYRKELQNYNLASFEDSASQGNRGIGRKYKSTEGYIYARRFARPQLAGHVSGYSSSGRSGYGSSYRGSSSGGSITVGVDLRITSGRRTVNGFTTLGGSDVSISIN